jgi:DNA helicase-2/ATP-dependent DNA helicase PcrA
MIEKLNDKQLEAVRIIDSNLMIVAGPGAGKTKTIINKIAYLLENNVNPKNILALTFTNKAAKEMKERLNKLVGDKAKSVYLSTFHAFALRTLKIYPLKPYGKNFTVYDDRDSLSIIKNLSYNFEEEISANEVLSLISLLKDEMIDINNSKIEPWIKNIYNDYQKILLDSNAMDFGDLILNLIKRTKIDKFGEYLSSKYKFIIVDEFQDTNIAQYELLKSISSNSIVTVVGDEDQSIYGWRGAEIKNMLKFPEDFKAKKVILNINYRSLNNIVEYSQNLIKNNALRFKKEIKSISKENGQFEIIDFSTDKDEARFIAVEINNLLARGVNPKEIAIFYRVNSQSKLIEEYLRSASISYHVVGDVSFYQRKEIKDIVYFLRLAVNQNDSQAFQRIINTPPRGIGKNTVKIILEESKTLGGIENFMNTLLFSQVLPASKKYKIYEFWNKIKQLKDFSADKLDNFLKEIEYFDYIKRQDMKDNRNKTENVYTLLEELKNVEDIEQWLDYASLMSSSEENDDKDSVSLMTLHSSKGLEFEYCFITGVISGLIPKIGDSLYDTYNEIFDKNEDIKLNQYEEERRLFYVGITRAKKGVYILYSRKKMIHGKIKETFQSPFINELSIKVSKAEPLKKKTKINNIFKKPESKEIELKDFGFKKGMKVKHPSYGEGEILAVIPSSDDQKLIIYFSGKGKKVMSGALAPLTLVK